MIDGEKWQDNFDLITGEFKPEETWQGKMLGDSDVRKEIGLKCKETKVNSIAVELS